MSIFVFVFEIIGTIAFSISGAMVAIEKKMDVLGVLFMGLITSVGGGVIRDILLGELPPKVFLNPTYPLIAMAVALVTFIIVKRHMMTKHAVYSEKILFVMDSVGLAVFTVVGVELSQEIYGVMPILNMFMGVVTAVGGGVLRDVSACRIPYIFTKHFYATASIIGAGIYMGLSYVLDPIATGSISMICIVLMRMLAAKYKWDLPRAE